MLYKIGTRFFRREGECNRCGFCCRKDYANLRAFQQMEHVVRRRYGQSPSGKCRSMVRAEDGKPTCLSYSNRGDGCRRFPWHPRQLDNIKRDDLPRVPTYNIGYTPTIREEIMADPGENKPALVYQELEDGVKKEELEIIGWMPFSTICSYYFTDVTDEIEEMEVKPDYLPEVSPVITYLYREGF